MKHNILLTRDVGYLAPALLTYLIQPITIAPSTHLCHVAESIEGFSFRPIFGGETACPPRFVLGSPSGGRRGEHELRKGVHSLVVRYGKV